MQEPAERDWVLNEAKALLAADPELRANIERQEAAERAGTLRTFDTAAARRVIDERNLGLATASTG